MIQALVIGRFQLVGNHHVDLFKQIIEFHKNKSLDKLNVAIGVANNMDKRNPFSAEECLKMIEPIAKETAEQLNIPLEFQLIPDIHNPPKYAAHVAKYFKFRENDEIILFSENEYTNQCYRGKDNCEVVVVKVRIDQRSEMLRESYAKNEDISEFVPKGILQFLADNNAREKFQKYYS